MRWLEIVIKTVSKRNILMTQILGRASEQRMSVNRPKEEHSRQWVRKIWRPRGGKVLRNKDGTKCGYTLVKWGWRVGQESEHGLLGHGKAFRFLTKRNGKVLKNLKQGTYQLPLHCLKFPAGRRPFLGAWGNLIPDQDQPTLENSPLVLYQVLRTCPVFIRKHGVFFH